MGARALKQMIASDPPDIAKVETIHEIEHACRPRTHVASSTASTDVRDAA
jgi:hypothetical protein